MAVVRSRGNNPSCLKIDMVTVVMSTTAMLLDMRKPVESTFQIKKSTHSFRENKEVGISREICVADSKMSAI